LYDFAILNFFLSLLVENKNDDSTMKTTTYSKETKTVIGLFECLSVARRKHLLERVQELILEIESENKWDHLLESSPDPMIHMANRALREHKSGHSKPMKL
jgi:hypothetical protein